MTDEHPQHPGIVLKLRFLDPLGITGRQLAQALAVSSRSVSELLTGRRALSPDMAMRLGLFFDVPPRWWLELQARFEADDPARLAELRSVVRPFAGLAEVLVTPAGIRRLEPEPAPAGPSRVRVSPGLLSRLRAQARQGPPRARRQPRVVYHEDGTLALTGE